ncbi:hypothetical protein [Herbaspirillum camelliae]|uniref:hypothetical protein n=1 Tax=Herbaspirillum camelliae TaxID=1892903 RepID=UPI00117A3534|nr:hypothetical protein [Herbaspirillum camelliae]
MARSPGADELALRACWQSAAGIFWTDGYFAPKFLKGKIKNAAMQKKSASQHRRMLPGNQQKQTAAAFGRLP